MRKKTVVIFSLVLFASLASAASMEPRHPLSQIQPVDTDFNMSDYSIYNLSELKLNDGGLGTGLVLDDFSIRDDGNNHGFTLNTGAQQWKITGSDLNLTGNTLTGVGGTQCPPGEALLGDGSCGATSDPQNISQVLTQGNNTEGKDIVVDNSNITSSNGNVSIGTDLKVHGTVWMQDDGSGSGSTGPTSSNLSQVLENGNSTGSHDIDMNGNSLKNFFQTSACPSGEALVDVNDDGSYQCMSVANEVSDVYVNRSGDTMEGDLDMNGNKLKDSTGKLKLAEANISTPGNQIATFTDTGITLNQPLSVESSGPLSVQNGIDLTDSTSNTISSYSTMYLETSSGSPTDIVLDPTGEVGVNSNLNLGGNNITGVQNMKLANGGTIDTEGGNIALNGGYLSNDGDNEGIQVDDSGSVEVSDLDVNGGTDTRLTLQSDDDGESQIDLLGNSQGTGRVYVGQSNSHGGGIEYNGDGDPSTTGAGSDYITLWRRDSGNDEWTARNKYSSNRWEFRGGIDVGGGLDMNGNMIKTTSCPSGMSNVNDDFCIESSTRSGDYWSTAVADCREEGYRLASYQDYIAACDTGVISNPDGEWFSNLYNDDDAFHGNSECGSSPPFNFEGTTDDNGMESNKPYRCVYDP